MGWVEEKKVIRGVVGKRDKGEMEFGVRGEGKRGIRVIKKRSGEIGGVLEEIV